MKIWKVKRRGEGIFKQFVISMYNFYVHCTCTLFTHNISSWVREAVKKVPPLVASDLIKHEQPEQSSRYYWQHTEKVEQLEWTW